MLNDIPLETSYSLILKSHIAIFVRNYLNENVDNRLIRTNWVIKIP